MSDLRGARVRVVGAGVVGICVSLELRRRGADVTLIDEETGTPNASAVAAGMIAPAFEAALEDTGQGRMPLFRAGRDLWPEMADGAIQLHRDGALAVAAAGGGAELARIAARLRGEDAAHEWLTPAAARELHPLLSGELAGGVFSPEDWRVDARAALQGLADRFAALGGRRLAGRPGRAVLLDRADALVICAGWGSRALDEIAPELACLRPIKGQLVRFPGAPPFGGPTLRAAGGYLAPSAEGAIAGASMEEGRADRALSPEVEARLSESARTLFPHLARARPVGEAGVRAATPDGLPLVGPSQAGLHLATGFRRNGWLLAPLAARITADQLAGRDPGPWAEAFRPDRFANPART